MDTGSYVSTLSASDVKNSGITVLPTKEKAIAYGGTSIDLIGECISPIKLGQVVFQHRFLVVNENEVNLFGRDLCSKFDLKISLPSEINNINNNVLSKYNDYFSTPEIKVECKDELKFKIMEELKKIVKKEYKNVNDIDGVRVESNTGWWLIRASNTQPCLIVRCEAKSDTELKKLTDQIKQILLNFRLKMNYYK